MADRILGIHHVTAIAGDPQANVDFYAGVLGQRLVKRTVNFDDPGVYHLYYGDETGQPGTIMTFFPQPGVRPGQRGTGQAIAASYVIPPASMGYWINRLRAHRVAFGGPVTRFGDEVLTLHDPDDLQLELVAGPDVDDARVWIDGPVPEAHAIRGLHGVTLAVDGYEHTVQLLVDTLHFVSVGTEEGRCRFRVGEGPGAILDVLCAPMLGPGRVAGGSVHHVAWRVPDSAAQQRWRERLAAAGLNLTLVLDRHYFQSLYFREPGGVLFEVATDPPGFTRDEDPAALGMRLMLPPRLESRREALERHLPPLIVPERSRQAGSPGDSASSDETSSSGGTSSR